MSRSGSLKLNPAAVRERAKSVAGCKEVVAHGESVISFMVGLNKPGQAHALARVNIFVDTGTVGTCRVLGGKMRQTFRRNVSSLDVVERLLKKPEKLLSIDESLIGMHDEETKQQEPTSPRSLKKELELADVGLCILQGEREKLQKHMEFISESVPNGKDKSIPNADDDSDSSTTSTLAGMEFQFSLPADVMAQVDQRVPVRLPADVMAQVDQCLKDITRMDKLVKGVATNGKGTVFLYGNGGVAYTPSIPRALYQKLRQLRHSTYSARPCYISLGTRDRYYVAFHDGTA
eukprot:CAMPEP_0117068898 /NCGR_PEP_ID=MMETSP0472-20121206/48292_1 /TAXON_ID=693140 ORGANISM="Tiarina fusus, Strain LIS" /NCGR_SAMPLE_ID=MMETSP0472 /ASSEMBLY_ACC=CAM_ASM_000603 /LENGTH=289 /DNA_ID=CAMNT_0004791155 /DNA_START=132 /DNA_END=998 /DNA_ORIENTATION=+